MPTLTETLTSYVPALTLGRTARDPAPLQAPEAETLASAVLFADISGFTALAERLSHAGPAGAEELIRILNAYFSPFIDRVYAHGGDVVKFAGDALLAVWPASSEHDLAEVTQRAAQCGLALQHLLSASEVSAEATLALRVAIGAGRVSLAHVGGMYGRWELLVTGAPIAELATVSHAGQPGEVVLTASAWQLVYDRASGSPLPAGGVRLDSVDRGLMPRPTPIPTLGGEAERALRFHVPGAVRSRLEAGLTDWLAELRQVSVLFVKLSDLDHQTPLAEAQRAMEALQAAVYRFEGSINKLSVDEKGVTLLAALGLPPLSHGDDPVRAVRVAIALRQALDRLGMRTSIGIATGRVFCGEVGNDRRREYTVIGDPVNLAARLMQAADGGILCDGRTHAAARHALGFEALDPITVKGKQARIEVFRPTNERRGTGPLSIPMVGRDKERTQLTDALEALTTGVSRLAFIEAEAGLGKSRLVSALADAAPGLGVTFFAGGGDAIERSTPYFAWQPIVSRVLALDPAADPAERREAVMARLGSDPALVRLAPLLNDVLHLELPDNDLTSELTGELRAHNTTELLITLLNREAAEHPSCLVIEDAHWLDSASWHLLALAVERVAPLAVVLTTRPLSDPVPTEFRTLKDHSGALFLTLGNLEPAEIERLVAHRLGVDALPEAVSTLIRERAEGHPFFSEELAYALRDAGHIVIEDGTCRLAPGAGDLMALDLPNTVEGVITSRLDRLTPSQQLALKVASVIGRVFAVETLEQVYPVSADRLRLVEDLKAIRRLEITTLETPEPSLAYLFKHMITHEVVYNLMPFSQRQQLHKSVAEWCEQAYEGDLEAHYALLAHHWRRADEIPRAIAYLVKAGEQAVSVHALQEAEGFLEDALALVTERPGTGNSREAHLHQLLGHIALQLGRLQDARIHLERSLALLGHPVPRTRADLALTLVLEAAQAPVSLMRHFHALVTPRTVAQHERMKIIEMLAEVYFFVNERLRQMVLALGGMNLVSRVGNASERARMFGGMAIVMQTAGLPVLADLFAHKAECFIARAEESLTRANGLMRLCIRYRALGQLDATFAATREAAALAERLDDRRTMEVCRSIECQAFMLAGRFDEAETSLNELFRLARQRGDVQRPIDILLNLALIHLDQGRWGQVMDDLSELPELLTHGQDDAKELDYQGLYALASWHLGDRGTARALLDRYEPQILTRPIGYFNIRETYYAFTDLALELAAEAAPGAPRRAALDRARRLMRRARQSMRHLPCHSPNADLLEGRLEWLAGRHGLARRWWRRALATAERMGMAVPIAEARRRLAGA